MRRKEKEWEREREELTVKIKRLDSRAGLSRILLVRATASCSSLSRGRERPQERKVFLVGPSRCKAQA